MQNTRIWEMAIWSNKAVETGDQPYLVTERISISTRNTIFIHRSILMNTWSRLRMSYLIDFASQVPRCYVVSAVVAY